MPGSRPRTRTSMPRSRRCRLRAAPWSAPRLGGRGAGVAHEVRVVRGPEKPLRATSCRRKKFAGLSGTKSPKTGVCVPVRVGSRQGRVCRTPLDLPMRSRDWTRVTNCATGSGRGADPLIPVQFPTRRNLMLIVSCRKAFWDNEQLAAKDGWKNQIAIFRRNRMRKNISVSDLQARVKNGRVLVLVHGYYNGRNKVLRAYRTINKNERNWIGYYDLVMGFTWPGGDELGDYPTATGRVPRSSDALKELLKCLNQQCPVVDVMSHSLGGRVSLLAYKKLHIEKHKFGNTINRQYLFAPAVHNDSIHKGEEYHEASGLSDKCCVFYTTQDGIICWGYSHYEKPNSALGCAGPEDRTQVHANVNLVGCQNIIREHGSEKSNDRIYEYIRKIVDGEEVPQFYFFQ